MALDDNKKVSFGDLKGFMSSYTDKMKQWVLDHQEVIDLEQVAIRLLNEANHKVVGLTGVEKAQYNRDAIMAIYNILAVNGFNSDSKELADISGVINEALNSQGAFIVDVWGERWTAVDWDYYRQQHGGQYPAIPVCLLMTTPTMKRYLTYDFDSLEWGTYGQAVPNLTADVALVGDYVPFEADNTREIIKFANPKTIWDWEEQNGILHTDVFLFATYAEALADAQQRYALMPVTFTSKDIYIVGTEGAYSSYYWKEGSFVQKLASVPLVDATNITGSPANEWCYNYGKRYNTDAAGIEFHNESGYEYLQYVLMRAKLSACNNALSFPVYPTGSHSTCLQNLATSNYYGNGTSLNGNGYKTNKCSVVGFAYV